MKQSDYDDLKKLRDCAEQALCDFGALLQAEDSHLYEQWKAGGKQVTNEFVSMYPNMTEVVDRIEIDQEESDEEDEPDVTGNY